MSDFSKCTVEDLNQFIVLSNKLASYQNGTDKGGQINVTCQDIERAYNAMKDVKWTMVTFGTMAGKAQYTKTPHGIVVQGQDGMMSLFSPSVAQMMLGIAGTELV